MTIVNGPLDVHGGLTVTSGGVGVTDGFTVAGGGLVVQQGGIQVIQRLIYYTITVLQCSTYICVC